MIDLNLNADEILRLTTRQRVVFGLGIAESVVDELTEDAAGLALARRALDISWRWVAGEPVPGDEIAEFVDSPTENDLGSRELHYTSESMIGALIAVVLAVGLTARRAYEQEGSTSMPSPIWEINDQSLFDIVRSAMQSRFYDVTVVRGLLEYLSKRRLSDEDSAATGAMVRSNVLKHMRP